MSELPIAYEDIWGEPRPEGSGPNNVTAETSVCPIKKVKCPYFEGECPMAVCWIEEEMVLPAKLPRACQGQLIIANRKGIAATSIRTVSPG